MQALNVGNGNVKLLPSSKNFDWACAYDEITKAYVNEAEVITVGRARNANTKYCNGKFIASQNHIIESYDKKCIDTKFLYFFILQNDTRFYSAESTYPMFTKMDFDDLNLHYPIVKEQNKVTALLDCLDDLISLHQRKCLK